MSNAAAVARTILKDLNAPRGAVNARVERDVAGELIRVSIDPLQWFLASRVPTIHSGIRVVVETREPALAH